MEEKLKKVSAVYHNVEIPSELSLYVEDGINTALNTCKKTKNIKPWIKAFVSAAAVFVFLMNASPAFAIQIYGLPILGDFARLVTVRNYREYDETKDIEVHIPEIRDTGNMKLEQRINSEIQARMQKMIDDAELEASEYRKAFLETGGKAWEFMPVNLYVNYDLKCSNDGILSFEISKTNTMASAYTEYYYYNIDLISGKEIGLNDILGDNFKDIADAQINKQIDEWNLANPDYKYFPKGEGGFEGISDNQAFYINEKGNAVIVFPKYAIAMGAMGRREFEIIKE